MSKVEIDGVSYDVVPEVAGLLQAVSEERDEAKRIISRFVWPSDDTEEERREFHVLAAQFADCSIPQYSNDPEQTDDVNTAFLMERIDAIHDELCGDKSGTWQARADQAVWAAREYKRLLGESRGALTRIQAEAEVVLPPKDTPCP